MEYGNGSKSSLLTYLWKREVCILLHTGNFHAGNSYVGNRNQIPEAGINDNASVADQKGWNIMNTHNQKVQNRKKAGGTDSKEEGSYDNGLQNGMTQEEYSEYVKQVTPVNNITVDVIRAFLTGGTICLVGQCINRWLTGSMNLAKEDAASWTSIILVGISVLLTGFNLYSKIVKWGGAGALVPITGFANSVASPAIEAQTEGQVFGIGCSIFKIAGPVILYGVFASWVLGIVYWIWQMWMPLG